MSIQLSTQLIHSSFASVIQSIDSSAHIYDNPNQQGTDVPAWFIVHRSPVEVQRTLGVYRTLVVYNIDIWYMLQQNITCLYDKYSAIAEQLDAKLTYLPIFNAPGVKVHVYDRSWGLEMNAMKYSTTLRLRVKEDFGTTEHKMDVISDLSVFLKNNGWDVPPKPQGGS